MDFSTSKHYYLHVSEFFFKKYTLHVYGEKNQITCDLTSGIQAHVSRVLLFNAITTMCNMTYLL